MLRTVPLVESRDTLVDLEPEEAEALRQTGLRLASKKAWWGAAPVADGEDADTERTVLRVRPGGAGKWWVRVNDAVGVIATSTVQLVIAPKIPTSHLLFLLAESGQFPRLDEQKAEVPTSATLWDLVASWFVVATERLLRLDLVRDYSEARDALPAARGQIQVLPTGRLFYAGRLELDCAYDEFAYDTPLNRLLKAATRTVAGSDLLMASVRRRAIRILSRLDEVGEFQPSDTRAHIERRTGHYADAVALGRHVLAHEGRAIASGTEAAWTFLIRTPEMVEAGVLEVLRKAIGETHVRKEGKQLVGSTMTFTPDLVFDGGAAVGDVKYKLSGGDWARSDLYQIVAFAEAFQTPMGAIVRFRRTETAPLEPIVVGQKHISELTWCADPELSPAAAAAALAADVATWLDPLALALSA